MKETVFNYEKLTSQEVQVVFHIKVIDMKK